MLYALESLGAMGGGGGPMAKVGGGVLAVTTLFKAIEKVGPNEMGVRLRNSRAERIRDSWFGRGNVGDLYGIVGPGMHPVIPFTHSIAKVNVGHRSNDLAPCIFDREDTQYKADASVVWHVMKDGDHPYRALFNLEGTGSLTETVTNECLSGLRVVMEGIDIAKLKNRREVRGAVIEETAEVLDSYGVRLHTLNLLSVARSIGEMLKPVRPGETIEPGAVALAVVDQAPDLHVIGGN